MAIYIVHPGTGTILDAKDGVQVLFFDVADGVDGDDDEALVDLAKIEGVDILDIIDNYLGEEN